MGKTYYIESGSICELSKTGIQKHYIKRTLNLLRNIFYACVCVSCTLAITWYVYQNSVTVTINECDIAVFELMDCITTGSLFATFGSAIVAVATLYTSKYITRFYDDISTLMQELNSDEIGSGSWRRWGFIPQMEKLVFSSSKPKYIGLYNATITFYIHNKKGRFIIPTTESDIKESFFLWPLLRMTFLRKKYFQYLEDIDLLEDYLVWECIFDTYKSAMLYRTSKFFVWIGSCFIAQSIIFAFFYPELCNIFL